MRVEAERHTRWKEAERLFHACVDLAPALQAAWLRAECTDDAGLERDVAALLDADRAAGTSYLESPSLLLPAITATLSGVAAGELLCGRFEILREIAAGGMGQVFEAMDLELNVPVAVKVIRPDISLSATAAAHFRNEVRLARTITHPNICRTYDLERDVVEDGGRRLERLFLTMELLSGETLSTRLRREGPIPPEQCSALSGQLVRALSAAHARDVIHGDLKPSNIMLTPDPSAPGGTRAVVTDFGLASLESLPGSGPRGGTPEYMAPEQRAGHALTAAADIYALGLVLLEMVTGVRAEAAVRDDAAARHSALQRALGNQPAFASRWDKAITACLERNPEDRPQSAELLGRTLDGAPAKAGYRPRSLHLVLACVILVSLFLGGLRLWQWRRTSVVQPGAKVFLANLVNQTGDERLNQVGSLLQATLAQSPQFQLLETGRADDILQSMSRPAGGVLDEATAREVAMRAGAARVVFATLGAQGDRRTLSVHIQVPDVTPARYRTERSRDFSWEERGEDAPLRSAAAAVHRAGEWVRSTLGEDQNTIARLDVLPQDVTTSDWQALREFADAERFAARDEREQALAALGRATARDPDFALAYARAGDILVSLDRRVEGYEAYERALTPERMRRLTRRERDFIKGAFASDTGDYLTAEQSFQDAAEFYENDFRAAFFRAFPLRMMGRYDEAVHALEHAMQLEPGSGGVWMGLAYNWILLRDFAQARGAVAKLTAMGRNEDASLLRGYLDALQGDDAAAQRDFAALTQSSSLYERGLGERLLARLAAERGDVAGASTHMSAAMGWSRRMGAKEELADEFDDLAFVQCTAGSYAACFHTAEDALANAPRPDTLATLSGTLGAALNAPLNTAERRTAVGLLDRLQTPFAGKDFGVITELARHRIAGERLLAQGDPRKALAEFRQADVIDAPITDRDYLARGLEAAARSEPSPAKRTQMLAEGERLRRRMVEHPELLWHHPMFYPPGFLRAEASALEARRK